MEKIFFITGATGLLGSRLAYNLISSGYKTICLSRSKDNEDAYNRVLKSVSFWSEEGLHRYKDNLEIIEGDIEKKNLGLHRETIARLGNIRPVVIHCAACTSFDLRDRDSLFKTNLEGTINATDAARLFSASQFNHISTAYVAGNCGDIFSENDFDVGQSFKNAYESSKFEAEKAVRKFGEETGIQALIFRPSIIMGDHSSGKTFNFNAIYTYLRVINAIKGRGIEKKEGEIRFECRKDVVKNIIPIDYAADSVSKIILSSDEDSPQTYHITNPGPPSFSGLNDSIHRILSVNPLNLVESLSDNGDKSSKTELLLKNAMKSYRPYLFHEPLFASMRTNTILEEKGIFFPQIDEAYYKRIVDFFTKRHSHNLPERSGIIKIFELKMRLSVGSEIIPNLKSLTKDFILCISDIGVTYYMSVENGRLVKFAVNESPEKAVFKFITSCDTFEKLLLMKVGPQEAFFKKLVRIEGSVIDALSLSTVFEEFFALFNKETNASQMV